MFKTRLISGIVLVILALSDDYQLRTCASVDADRSFLYRYAGVVSGSVSMKERQMDWKLPVIWSCDLLSDMLLICR